MAQYSNSATRQFLNLGSRFAAWCSECVGAFIDDLAQRRAGDGPGRALLVLGSDGADLFARRHGRLAPVGSISGDAAMIAATARKKLSKAERQDLAIRLSGHRAVVSQVTLPTGARPVVDAIVRNKVESLAPWPAEDAVWGYRLVDEPQNGQFAVTVGIAGRKPLAALMEALAAVKIEVTGADIHQSGSAQEAIALDFNSNRRRDKALGAVRAVMAGVLFFAVTIGGYGLWQALAVQAELNRIEARTEKLTAALRVQTVSDPGSDMAALAEQAVTRKQSEPPLLQVLTTLTQRVPDSAWLTSIDYRGQSLTIAGRGESVPPIIESLEGSELFSKVDFAAAIQRDPEANADMFSISAAIGEAQEATP